MSSENANIQPDSTMSASAIPVTILDQVKQRAVEVFADEGKGERWLYQENLTLGNQRPIDLIDTPEGREAVAAELTRIEWGIY